MCLAHFMCWVVAADTGHHMISNTVSSLVRILPERNVSETQRIVWKIDGAWSRLFFTHRLWCVLLSITRNIICYTYTSWQVTNWCQHIYSNWVDNAQDLQRHEEEWSIQYISQLWVWYRFSAFWLRSKCSICSYQLNIWYVGHVPSSILNWFL